LLLPAQNVIYSPGRRRTGIRGTSNLVFEVVQRPPAERRKARSENEARVGEIGIGDDALGDDGLRFLEIRLDQFLAQIGSRAAGPALARLAVFPEVKAAAGLPAEVPGGDERGEL